MVKDLKEKLDKYDNEKKSVVKMEKAKRDNALLKHEQVSLKITICHIDKNDCHGQRIAKWQNESDGDLRSKFVVLVLEKSVKSVMSNHLFTKFTIR